MDAKQKTKKELIQILQENNHPNSLHLDKFSKNQLQKIFDESCLKKLPDILVGDGIENKEEVIQQICQIVLPTKKHK